MRLFKTDHATNIHPAYGRTDVSPFYSAEGESLTWRQVLGLAKAEQAIVPIRPCEHGHYDPHRVPSGCTNPGCLVYHVPVDCDGAGLGNRHE